MKYWHDIRFYGWKKTIMYIFIVVYAISRHIGFQKIIQKFVIKNIK